MSTTQTPTSNTRYWPGLQITAQLWVGAAGLAGMVVSRGRSVERSRLGWFSYPLPVALVAWLSNDVPACRGLAVAWLIRGARAPSEIPGIGRARHGRYPRSRTGRRAFPWWW